MVAMNVWPTDAADGSVSSEARWRKMGRLWAPTGVAAASASAMLPTLAFPNLTVKAGACWVDGHFCELLGDQVLAVTANGLAVVRFDPAANTAQLLYLDGATVPSQSPTGVYELPIAKIVGSALTDMRTPSGPANIQVQGTTQTGIGAARVTAATLTIAPRAVAGVFDVTGDLRLDAPTGGDVWQMEMWIGTIGNSLIGRRTLVSKTSYDSSIRCVGATVPNAATVISMTVNRSTGSGTGAIYSEPVDANRISGLWLPAA